MVRAVLTGQSGLDLALILLDLAVYLPSASVPLVSLVLCIHCISKKEATCCLIIILANVDRFSKWFHQLVRKKIICVYRP